MIHRLIDTHAHLSGLEDLETALQRAINAGVYAIVAVSATPAVEYSKAHRGAIREAPLEQIVLETDCPVTYRGSPSEPLDILRTLRAVAELRGIPEEEVAKTTTRTAMNFFKIS